MLFHFHQQQKSKKPGSIHAVYLLSGFAAVMRPAPTAQNGSGGDEDSYMQSSPFMSSSMLQKEDCEEPPAVRSIAMCREEELGGNKCLTQHLYIRRTLDFGKLLRGSHRDQEDISKFSINTYIQPGT